MDAAHWYKQLGEALTDKTCLAVASLVNQLFQTATTSYDRGLAYAARTVLYHRLGPAHTMQGLHDAELAFELLEGDSAHQLLIMMIALSLCYSAGDALKQRATRYHTLMQAILVTDREAKLRMWHGRCCLAMGQHHIIRKSWRAAEEILSDALAWYQSDCGPFDEYDRQCNLALSYLLLGFVRLNNGAVDAARGLLEQAIDTVPADSWHVSMIDHLTGYIALAGDDLERARQVGEQLVAAGGIYTSAGAEILAKYARKVGDVSTYERMVDYGRFTAAAHGFWNMVNHLENMKEDEYHPLLWQEVV